MCVGLDIQKVELTSECCDKNAGFFKNRAKTDMFLTHKWKDVEESWDGGGKDEN
jgi:hypothetical protein